MGKDKEGRMWMGSRKGDSAVEGEREKKEKEMERKKELGRGKRKEEGKNERGERGKKW